MTQPMTEFHTYLPGTWFGVFGDQVTVLLPPTEKGRVAALWELVDDGAGFDETLDALIASGLRDLPGFVLVAAGAAGATKVVLRGAASARFTTADGEVVVDGTSASTWVERSLEGVLDTVIEVEEGAEYDGAELTVAGGLVRVSRVEHSAESVVEPAESVVEPASGASGVETPPDAAESVVEPAESVVEPASGASGVETPPGAAVSVAGPAESVVEPASEASGVETTSDAQGPPEPPRWQPVPAPAGFPPPAPYVAAGSPAVGDAGSDDHDGLTRGGGWNPSEFARQQPGIPGQQPAPSVTAEPVAKLVFSNGETVPVDRAIIVGRAPEARRFTSAEQPRLVTVPSPHQEISSTHLEVRPGSGADHGSAVVTDLGSTNGTVLVQPGLGPEDLQPGIAVQLIPGAIIDLGDGVTIQVTQA